MKLSKMQIRGFGYLNNIATTGGKTIVTIHLKANENELEDVWLKCTACQEISNYIERELLFDLDQGNAVLLKFCANYAGFSEVFNTQESPNERIVIFNAKLEVIEDVYINGSHRSVDTRQAIAV